MSSSNAARHVRRRAFSLMEVLMVLTITSILTAVAGATYTEIKDRAAEREAKRNVDQVLLAQRSWAAKHASWTDKVDELDLVRNLRVVNGPVENAEEVSMSVENGARLGLSTLTEDGRCIAKYVADPLTSREETWVDIEPTKPCNGREAIIEALNVTISFNANGGNGTMSAQTAAPGSALSVNTYSRSGYQFAGWNTNPDGTGDSYPDGAAHQFADDTTVYAQWLFEPISATGGDTITDIVVNGVTWRVHTYTSVGASTFTVTDTGSQGTVEYLVVGGGGAGGQDFAGGGGGGGVRSGSGLNVTAGNQSVVVGGGGLRPTGSSNQGSASRARGADSTFTTITALGGGGGAGSASTNDAGNGGSGGGAGQGRTAGAGTEGQGFSGAATASGVGGGGGGAGGPGLTNGDGGPGILSAITGTPQYFGGGGAGASQTAGGVGGSGGGGSRTSTYQGTVANGVANTGGGGAGYYGSLGGAGNGGSGIVIVRYPVSDPAGPKTPVAADPVTGLRTTAGNQQVTLTWTAPAYNGGTPITDYNVEYATTSNFATPVTVNDGTSTSTTLTVTNLTNGTPYWFRVRAVNAAGNSAWSSATATPSGPAGAPGDPTATAGNQQITLTWTSPGNTGGTPIVAYLVEYNAGSGWIAARTVATTNATLTGLTNGTSYSLRVSAYNSAGYGTPATASATPRTVPDAPGPLTVTTGNQQATVAWTAPNANGDAISDYVVQYATTADFASPTTFADGVSTTTTATVTGLQDGTTYWFRVGAVNAAGTGAWTGAQADLMVSNGLFLYLDATDPVSYPGSGTTWFDRSGNANHGTLTNGPAYTNNAFTLDGVDDTVALPFNLSHVAALSDFTLEIWARFPSYPQPLAAPNQYGVQYVSGVLFGAAYYTGTAIYVHGTNDGTGGTVFGYIRGADGYKATTPRHQMTLSTWKQFTIVNNRSLNLFQFYVDGALVSQTSSPTQEYASNLSPTAGNLGISKSQIDGGDGTTRHIASEVSVAKVYKNKALTAAEVLQNFNAMRGRYGL